MSHPLPEASILRRRYGTPRQTLFLIALAAFVLLISGCSKNDKQPGEVVYSLKTRCNSPYSVPVKISISGQEKGSFNQCNGGSDFLIKITKPELGNKDISAGGLITAQALFPEGWTDVPVKVEPAPHLGDNYQRVVVDTNLRPPIHLYIDKRGSDAEEFFVGQLRLFLQEEMNVPAPIKQDAAKLKINDVILGALPTADSFKEPPNILVDVSGERTYKLSCTEYVIDPFANQKPRCERPKLLKGKHVYRVPSISHFLTPAPVRGAPGISHELLDITDTK